MKILYLRWSILAFVLGTLTVLLAGCIVPSGRIGYDGDVEVGVGAAYYEPYGAGYGGWGPGYQVAPYRGGGHRPPGGVSHASEPAKRSEPAFRSAPASRSMPSLPPRGGRGDGGRGDGGRGDGVRR